VSISSFHSYQIMVLTFYLAAYNLYHYFYFYNVLIPTCFYILTMSILFQF
jgi:hypothetical protein